MSDDGIKAIGAERLSATLHAAGRRLADMTDAGAKAAQSVATDARRRAPIRTGRLARSISTRAQRGNAQTVVTAPYGMFLEYGTRFIAAQPYLRPALDAQQTRIVDTYAAEVREILSTVKGA